MIAVMEFVVVQKLAIAAGLGLLVGLQREWTAPHVAGLRTFALLTAAWCDDGIDDGYLRRALHVRSR